MQNEIIFYIEESIEGGFEAKALGSSIFTEGDDMDILKKILLMLCTATLIRIKH